MRYGAKHVPLILTENDILDLGAARVSWRQENLGRRLFVDGALRLEALLDSGQTRCFEAGEAVYKVQAGDDVLLVELA